MDVALATHAASLGVGPRLTLRAWHKRRDRSAIEHWPQAELPPHWGLVESSTGPRNSYALDLTAEQRLIGRITLRDMTADSARLGIYLHPAYTSQGFGSEALVIFCAYADGVLQLASLALDVAADNERAIRCYRRCGFVTRAIVARHGHKFYEMERYASATTRPLSPSAGSGPARRADDAGAGVGGHDAWLSSPAACGSTSSL